MTTLAGTEQPADPRSIQLARQMRQWREALDRTTFTSLPGRKRHVTQEEAAVLCGLSLTTYRGLENGNSPVGFSDDVLDRVAAVLRLSAVSRRVLYLLATGRDPKPQPGAPLPITPVLQAKLDCQPWPAYVIDSCWNVLAFNAATLQWFPHLAYERNALRAVAGDLELRSRLVDWETVWLPRAIALLKGQISVLQDPELHRLARQISNMCPQSRHWLFHDRTVWMYEDGDHRELYIPGSSEPTTVSLSAEVPSSNSGPRYISVVPVAGHIPQECRAHLSPAALTVA